MPSSARASLSYFTVLRQPSANSITSHATCTSIVVGGAGRFRFTPPKAPPKQLPSSSEPLPKCADLRQRSDKRGTVKDIVERRNAAEEVLKNFKGVVSVYVVVLEPSLAVWDALLQSALAVAVEHALFLGCVWQKRLVLVKIRSEGSIRSESTSKASQISWNFYVAVFISPGFFTGCYLRASLRNLEQRVKASR